MAKIRSFVAGAGALALVLVFTGCGGDDAGEPLIAGDLEASYDGDAFTPAFGFATLLDGGAFIALGDGDVRCGSEQENEPPSGHTIAFGVEAFEVGSYSSVFVQMFDNVGSFEGVGSNTGTVELTAVSDTSIAGSLDFSFTDDEGRTFSASGTFEVLHCAP
jgi:hypothetical protein